MIAKRSGAENFQDSKSADKIQNGIKQRDIDKFRALHDKAMKRNPQNDQSTNRIDRQNTVKRGWAKRGTDKRHYKANRTGGDCNNHHHLPDFPKCPDTTPSRAQLRSSISPLRTSSPNCG